MTAAHGQLSKHRFHLRRARTEVDQHLTVRILANHFFKESKQRIGHRIHIRNIEKSAVFIYRFRRIIRPLLVDKTKRFLQAMIRFFKVLHLFG